MPSIFSPEVGGGGGFEAICVGCAFLLFKSWPLTLSQTDTYEANKGAPLQDCWFVGSQNDGFQLLTDKSGGGGEIPRSSWWGCVVRLSKPRP